MVCVGFRQNKVVMNRFPEKYEKPELIPVNQGLNRGWLANCEGGGTPGSVGVCILGGVPNTGKNSDFLNSEHMQQPENRSHLLTD